MPIDEMAHSPFVASEQHPLAFGFAGGGIIALLVIVSTFGTTNGNVLGYRAGEFAMARQGNFGSWVEKPTRNLNAGNARPCTPYGPVCWCSADHLTCSPICWYLLAGFLRTQRCRDIYPPARCPTPRPYKVWELSDHPMLFVLFNIFFLVNDIIQRRNHHLSGHTPIINPLFEVYSLRQWVPSCTSISGRSRPVSGSGRFEKIQCLRNDLACQDKATSVFDKCYHCC